NSINQSDPECRSGYSATPHTRGHAPTTHWSEFDPSRLASTASTGSLPDASSPTAAPADRASTCASPSAAAADRAVRDEGQRSVDDPIPRHLPASSALTLHAPEPPTPALRMLLTMSAGFPTDNPWGDRQESISNDELDELLRGGLTFETVPGTTFAYSN